LLSWSVQAAIPSTVIINAKHEPTAVSRDAPIMLENLPIIPSSASQNL